MGDRHAVSAAARSFFVAFQQWSIATEACAARLQHNHRHITAGTTRRRAAIRPVSTQTRPGKGKEHLVSTIGHVKRGMHTQVQATPTEALKDSTSIGNDLRHALRTLAKPCVVVTSRSGPDGASYSGATLSSFDTVCLEPTPYISFNIRMPSRTYDAFRASKQICVHLLSATPESAAIADIFTKTYDDRQEPFRQAKAAGAQITDTTFSSAPRIQLKGSNIAWLYCSLGEATQEMTVGDHKICTFLVDSIVMADTAELNDLEALSYGQRAFRKLGEAIEPAMSSQSTQTSHKGSKPHILPASLTSRVRLKGIGSIPATAAAGFHSSIARNIATGVGPDIWQYMPAGDEEVKTVKQHVQKDDTPPVVDPQVLKQTVSDFLCHSHKIKTFRMKKARTARREAAEAADQLRVKMRDGTLTADDSAYLENIINSNERYVLIELAINATTDLKEMLDEGKVSRSRIQYIEACIERGQAALIEDAKAFAAGEPRTYHIKIHLPHDAAFRALDERFRNELGRLRDLYEEEVEND